MNCCAVLCWLRVGITIFDEHFVLSTGVHSFPINTSSRRKTHTHPKVKQTSGRVQPARPFLPRVKVIFRPISKQNEAEPNPISFFCGPLRRRRNHILAAFQCSPAVNVPERLHGPTQKKKSNLTSNAALQRERVRIYIQPKPNVALEIDVVFCGHDQSVDSKCSTTPMSTVIRIHPEHLHKEEATIGPVFVRRRRVFPCPSVRWFSTSRKTLSSRSLLTWCTRTCLYERQRCFLESSFCCITYRWRLSGRGYLCSRSGQKGHM
jgi:hypothetical protein